MNAEFAAFLFFMTIEKCRHNIDNIDAEILDLLDRRAAVVKEIAAIKLAAGIPIVDDQRERAVLDRAARGVTSVKRDAAVRIYREIIREARAQQLEMQCEIALAEEAI